MKLIDFTRFEPLNRLRTKMGAPLIDWYTEVNWKTLTQDEFLKKLDTGIIENIDPRDLNVDNNGVFELRGQKVLVYIRDQYYDPNYGEPVYKFHLCQCTAFQNAIQNNRINRYVVSRKTDGIFPVNLINRFGGSERVTRELRVCKFCLRKVKYKGYPIKKEQVYLEFNLKEFLSLYGGTNFKIKPIYDDATAPLNVYQKDFRILSNTIRKNKRWRCEMCGRKFETEHKFLQVHHINGDKSDNSENNLKCLCIKCHANEAMHKHLKASPLYRDYLRKFR
ncbi:MAG: HNH endonuclease signature motif containing protein [bacterium]|nr:HNH endonuclease signature motif containing protein [bacterium]